jgi:hypothetical protein
MRRARPTNARRIHVDISVAGAACWPQSCIRRPAAQKQPLYLVELKRKVPDLKPRGAPCASSSGECLAHGRPNRNCRRQLSLLDAWVHFPGKGRLGSLEQLLVGNLYPAAAWTGNFVLDGAAGELPCAVECAPPFLLSQQNFLSAGIPAHSLPHAHMPTGTHKTPQSAHLADDFKRIWRFDP